MMKFIFFFVFALGIAACQTAPTKVYEQTPAQQLQTAVVLDARPAFEYMSSHIPGSINVQWQDFSVPESKRRGELKLDLSREARRLALYGINPNTPVIVVGQGTQGDGAEGRLAWTLQYMGVKNAKAMSISQFDIPMTAAESPPPKNQNPWKPDYKTDLVVSRKDFLVAVKRIPRKVLVLDVRDEREYLKEDAFGALNIPWKNFMKPDGSAEKSMADQLLNLGHGKTKSIMVVSNTGVRSAYVTLLLRQLGFVNATNFASGYQSLQNR